jgi:ATP-binding cassette subfamily F protein 3
MHPSNILILDEPTNHLDVVSKQILKEAVKSYEGTLIVVSHDRTFLQGLTDKTYEFINTQIIEHLGDIEYVLAKRKHDDLRDYAVNTKTANKPKAAEAKKSELSFDERKKLNRELTYLERDIEKLEAKIKEIETQMLDPEFFKKQDAFKVTKEIDEMKGQIASKMERWEVVSEKLE